MEDGEVLLPKYGTVAARLPFDMFRRTQLLAEKQHRSVSNLIKHLLLQELKKEGLGGE